MAKTIPGNEQVFMVSKSTNTTYSGSAALKAMSEWYTMDDVSNTVKPYKVFTALLTQNGGSDELFILNGPVTKGVTYFIASASFNSDFSNVGGPVIGANDESFIATNSDIPNSYGGARLYYNTGAPVATVLENTIGNLWFTYNDVGTYFVNSNGLFINDTWTNISLNIQGFGDNINFSMYKYDGNSIGIISGIPGDTQVDSILNQTCVEIRVYN